MPPTRLLIAGLISCISMMGMVSQAAGRPSATSMRNYQQQQAKMMQAAIAAEQAAIKADYEHKIRRRKAAANAARKAKEHDAKSSHIPLTTDLTGSAKAMKADSSSKSDSGKSGSTANTADTTKRPDK